MRTEHKYPIWIIEDGLTLLNKSCNGLRIGNIPLTAIACADDLILLASTMEEMYALLLLITFYANRERFRIHPGKSYVATKFLPAPEEEHLRLLQPWKINDLPITFSHEFTHLGVDFNLARPSVTSVTVENRLQNGRKTQYALMGAGLHGTNGLKPSTSLHIYNMYVIPRVTYSLETLHILKLDRNKLEVFHRTFLRHIQSLPERTAIPGLHILLGTFPLQVTIDKNRLSLIPTIAQNPSMKALIIRQLAVKSFSSDSWIIKTQQLLRKYKLAPLLDLVVSPPTKKIWKKNVKTAIIIYWQDQIEKDAQAKSTLCMLNPKHTAQPHLIWSSCTSNPRDVRRAVIKARLVTDTYILQYNRQRFNQTQNATCLLCTKDIENREHFLLLCDALTEARILYLGQLLNLIPLLYLDHPHNWSSARQTQLILDPTHPDISNSIHLSTRTLYQIENMSRLLCFSLHTKRAQLMDYRY